MKTSRFLLAAILGFAIVLTLSCSGDDGGGHRTIKKEKISGISQKGPFAEGANVTIYELNANFEKTKNFFEGTTDGNGNFEIQIKNGKLASPYIIIEASGKYVSEVSGEQTSESITLRTVTDVSSKSAANINVLTHLEFERVLKLAKSGKKFDDAKRETQKQVFNSLGISESLGKNSEDISLFGSSPSDSALLIVSILLQGNRTTEYVSSLLDAISDEINKNGSLSNSVKSDVANGFANLDMDEVRANILKLEPSARVPDFDDIKNVVASIDPSAAAPSSSSVLPSSSPSSVLFSSSSVLSSSSVVPSSSSVQIIYGTPVTYGNETYESVVIGSQTWMARNLNYNAKGSVCYDDDPANCTIYGRLYDWETAMNVCPDDWHLPSDDEWNALMKVANPSCTDYTYRTFCEGAGTKLKATNGWNPYDGIPAGTDDYGFAALPGGIGYLDGNFDTVGYNGVWWSSSEYIASNAYSRFMEASKEDVNREGNNDKGLLFSVRCVMD